MTDLEQRVRADVERKVFKQLRTTGDESQYEVVDRYRASGVICKTFDPYPVHYCTDAPCRADGHALHELKTNEADRYRDDLRNRRELEQSTRIMLTNRSN